MGGSLRVGTAGTGMRDSKTGAAEFRNKWALGGNRDRGQRTTGLLASELGTWQRPSRTRGQGDARRMGMELSKETASHRGLHRQCMGPNASVKAEGCDLAKGQQSLGSRCLLK